MYSLYLGLLRLFSSIFGFHCFWSTHHNHITVLHCFEISLLFSLFALIFRSELLIHFNLVCFVFLSFSELTPVDPNATAGEYLNMTCQLNLNHSRLTKFNASNVYFSIQITNKRSHDLPTKYVHVVSNSRADLIYPDIDINSDARYIRCNVNTSTDTSEQEHILVDSQHMWVGCKYDRSSQIAWSGHSAYKWSFLLSSLYLAVVDLVYFVYQLLVLPQCLDQ